MKVATSISFSTVCLSSGLLVENPPRRYGPPPYQIAVIHGGPGAPGGMALVAQELSTGWSVLEPLQTAHSAQGQIDELRDQLEQYAVLPCTLIGSSWGALLSFLLAATCPTLVGKLILIGSAPFEDRYASSIQETRLSRLDRADRQAAADLMRQLSEPGSRNRDAALARLGDLFTRTDAYDPVTLDTGVLACQFDVHQRVWGEAQAMRASGRLLELGKTIQCPVVAVHGDYDPHPAEGIRAPLDAVLSDFRFILLNHCGHLPWIEREAQAEFYALLRAELPHRL